MPLSTGILACFLYDFPLPDRVQQGTQDRVLRIFDHGHALPKAKQQPETRPAVRVPRQDEDQAWSQDDQSQAENEATGHPELNHSASVNQELKPVDRPSYLSVPPRP